MVIFRGDFWESILVTLQRSDDYLCVSLIMLTILYHYDMAL